MKPGIYTVRGKSHGIETPKVQVEVTGEGLARFVFSDLRCVYRARPRSPFPERVEPKKLDAVDSTTARSIAHAAFLAAEEAAKVPPPEPEEAAADDLDLDALTLGTMRSRSAGPNEGRFTKHTS